MGFLSQAQIEEIGFAEVGENVFISEKASIYNAKNIRIKSHVRIDDFVILSAGEGGIFIGNHVHIACYVSLIGKEKIVLRDFVGISARSSIYSSNDDYSGNFLTGPTIPEEFKNLQHKPVIIGRHVIVGVNSCILPGIEIGEGCAIGAYSLVNKNVPPFMIMVGVPAKPLRKRSKILLDVESQFNKKKT